MNCPICPNTVLVMTERVGIEIDYCPKCRGVWLDRGELEKIIERSGGPVSEFNRRPDDDDDDDQHDSRRQPNDQRRPRRGFWSELFD